jgi:hypothetical protein
MNNKKKKDARYEQAVLTQMGASVMQIIPTLDTSVYAAGDVMCAPVKIENAVNVEGGTGMIGSLVAIDKDDQGYGFDVYFFDSEQSMGTVNAAISIAAADATGYLGKISVDSGDYDDWVNSQVAFKKDERVSIEALPAAKDIYAVLVSRGTGTYTVNGIVLNLGIYKD